MHYSNSAWHASSIQRRPRTATVQHRGTYYAILQAKTAIISRHGPAPAESATAAPQQASAPHDKHGYTPLQRGPRLHATTKSVVARDDWPNRETALTTGCPLPPKQFTGLCKQHRRDSCSYHLVTSQTALHLTKSPSALIATPPLCADATPPPTFALNHARRHAPLTPAQRATHPGRAAASRAALPRHNRSHTSCKSAR